MPIVAGIAGGAGSGKTSLVRAMLAAAPGEVAVVELDWYYREQAHLSPAEREQTNYDAPAALEMDRAARDLQQLRAGIAVNAPVYDFATHTRTGQIRPIVPKPFIVVEGILALADEELRGLYGLTVYVDAPSDLRFIRRLCRDTAERGRSMESVVRQYLEQVRPMHDQWVEPCKTQAQMVLSGEMPPEVNAHRVLERLRS